MALRHHIAICLLLCIAVSCGPSQKKAEALKSREFPLVQVPAMLDQEQRLDYILDHFWDAFTAPSAFLCDSAHIAGVASADVEQAFANYSVFLQQVPLNRAQACMKKLSDRIIACQSADTTSNILDGFGGIVERYLYDPNSPMRDEDIYTAYARAMAGCELRTEAERQKYAQQAQLSSLNARGSVAADFSFCNSVGTVRTLHSINSDYILLFFSNPGCEACQEIIGELQYPMINQMIFDGRLAVVNVYIDDDIQQWMAYQSGYPGNWFSGYDNNHIIRDDELYNVRAIPSLYLLGPNKRVILKDAPLDRVLGTLENLF